MAKVIHEMYKDYFVLVSVKDHFGIIMMKTKIVEETDDRELCWTKISHEVWEFKKITDDKSAMSAVEMMLMNFTWRFWGQIVWKKLILKQILSELQEFFMIKKEFSENSTK